MNRFLRMTGSLLHVFAKHPVACYALYKGGSLLLRSACAYTASSRRLRLAPGTEASGPGEDGGDALGTPLPDPTLGAGAEAAAFVLCQTSAAEQPMEAPAPEERFVRPRNWNVRIGAADVRDARPVGGQALVPVRTCMGGVGELGGSGKGSKVGFALCSQVRFYQKGGIPCHVVPSSEEQASFERMAAGVTERRSVAYWQAITAQSESAAKKLQIVTADLAGLQQSQHVEPDPRTADGFGFVGCRRATVYTGHSEAAVGASMPAFALRILGWTSRSDDLEPSITIHFTFLDGARDPMRIRVVQLPLSNIYAMVEMIKQDFPEEYERLRGANLPEKPVVPCRWTRFFFRHAAHELTDKQFGDVERFLGAALQGPTLVPRILATLGLRYTVKAQPKPVGQPPMSMPSPTPIKAMTHLDNAGRRRAVMCSSPGAQLLFKGRSKRQPMSMLKRAVLNAAYQAGKIIDLASALR